MNTNMEKKMNQVSESDRLISLPETLIYHIFSLGSISTKQAVQMSLLSRKWRYFWKSLSIINISSYCLCDGREQYFIDKVLTLHDASHVHTFFLETDFIDIEVELVDKLINFLLTKCVQQVHIQGDRIKMSKSALELFFKQSKHVRTMKLLHFDLINDGEGEEREEEELELRSSTLENLVLSFNHKCDCVTIDCPRLDYLKIFYENMDYYGILNQDRAFKIRAPELSLIHILGDSCDYSLEDMPSMIDAHLNFFDTCRDLFVKRLDSLLRLLGSIKSLTLYAHYIQEYGVSAMFWNEVHGIRFLRDAVQVSFPNLKYLKVVEWDVNNRIEALAKFIGLFCSIETLVLESNQGYEAESSDEDGMGGYKGLNWDRQLAFKSKYHKLKSFHIQFLGGDENELFFIDHILRSAPTLENITITMGKAPLNANLELMKFIKKVRSLPSYSSNVAVSVQEQNMALRVMEETELEPSGLHGQ